MTAPKKVKIEFIKNHTVQDERVGTPDEESYKEGDQRSMVPSSAEHFVSRDIAVYIGAAKKA